jgi:hypothetical protein
VCLIKAKTAHEIGESHCSRTMIASTVPLIPSNFLISHLIPEFYELNKSKISVSYCLWGEKSERQKKNLGQSLNEKIPKKVDFSVNRLMEWHCG